MKWTFSIRVLSGIVAVTAIIAGTGLAEDGQRKSLTVQGATTVAALIGPWTTEYQEAKDGSSVVVYGSTHGKGLEALFNQQADVAMLGKRLSEDEKAKGSGKGMKLEEVFLGYDAIPIIVNPANPVNELSFDQLRDIFTGHFKTWKGVGGPDEPIELITLPSDSALGQYIGKTVLKGEFGPKAQVISSITLTPKMVQGRKWAISFCRQDIGSKEHANGTLKMIKVRKDNNTPAVLPTTENNVANAEYPIIRELVLVYDSQTASETAKRFVSFCLKKAEADGISGNQLTKR